MQLNLRTDYALRMLMALAARDTSRTIERGPDALPLDDWVSIDWIADRYSISRNHLAKIAQDLVSAGFLETQRGRGGGIRLACPASEINVGAVVRELENTDGFVACMGGKQSCAIDGTCGLKPALSGALEAFLSHLDQFDLAQITGARGVLLRKLAPELE